MSPRSLRFAHPAGCRLVEVGGASARELGAHEEHTGSTRLCLAKHTSQCTDAEDGRGPSHRLACVGGPAAEAATVVVIERSPTQPHRRDASSTASHCGVKPVADPLGREGSSLQRLPSGDLPSPLLCPERKPVGAGLQNRSYIVRCLRIGFCRSRQAFVERLRGLDLIVRGRPCRKDVVDNGYQRQRRSRFLSRSQDELGELRAELFGVACWPFEPRKHHRDTKE
jgi:hypothetical protein